MDCWVYIFLEEGEVGAWSLLTATPFQGCPFIPSRSCEEVSTTQGGTSARILANKQKKAKLRMVITTCLCLFTFKYTKTEITTVSLIFLSYEININPSHVICTSVLNKRNVNRFIIMRSTKLNSARIKQHQSENCFPTTPMRNTSVSNGLQKGLFTSMCSCEVICPDMTGRSSVSTV
jgi:hypothetical protein